MTGAFGGSSRSLYEVLRVFQEKELDAIFVTQRGTVRDFFSRLGSVVETHGLTQFDNTRYSYYRGFRWVVLLRELLYLPGTIMALYRVKSICKKVDIIHLNEFTGLIPLWLAQRFFFKAPAVVHVRSVARTTSGSLRVRWVNWMLRHLAKAVIAIDETVRASLPPDLPVEVIHNSFDPGPSDCKDHETPDSLKRLRPHSFKVGFVGNLLKVKGILELIESAHMTRDRGYDIEFVIVGDNARSTRGFGRRILKLLGLEQNMKAEVESMIERYNLRDCVHLVGFTSNLSFVYRHMDVLCFPSHFDAPGRPVFEAAFFGVPSIVAARNPTADTLIHGKTGLAVSPRSAEQLAEAIQLLASDTELTKSMGKAAKDLALRNFNVQANAEKLLAVYRRIVSH